MTTSIHFHLRPSKREGRHPGRLFIRVIHARQSRHIPREYALYTDEWDAGNKRVVLPQSDRETDRSFVLSHIDESMQNDLKRLQEIVLQLSEQGRFSAADVVERFTDCLIGHTVRGYAEITGNRLRESERGRTARAYRSAARSLTNFNGGKDVLLPEIDAAFIAEYERYLLDRGLKLNTVSFYLRNIRALYFRAVAEKLIPKQADNPFAGTHTGVYETKRRALDIRQLQAFAKLEDVLAGKPEEGKPEPRKQVRTSALHDALLYFLFCYHARGMSFVDMAHLRRQDIGTETLTYRRRKTGGMLEVKITGPMRKILSHFARATENSEFVFPVIGQSQGNLQRQYETGLKRQNRSLKVLAQMAGIAEHLSTHAARHTWATLAKRLHIPVAVIGEALGHRDVKTTSIYLASFDRATMDDLSVKLSDVAKAA